MFTKADIRRVSIAVAERDYSRLMVSLGRHGIVHIDRDFSADAAGFKHDAAAGYSVDIDDAEKIISIAEDFFSVNKISYDDTGAYESVLDDVTSLFKRDTEADLHDAYMISKKLRQYDELHNRITRDIESTLNKMAELHELKRIGIDLDGLRKLKSISYLYFKPGSDACLENYDRRLFYIVSGDHMLALFPEELRDDLIARLRPVIVEDLDYIIRQGNTLQDEETAAENRLSELKKRLWRIDSFYAARLPVWRDRILRLYAACSILRRIAGAESKLIFSGELVIINGWMDAAHKGRLEKLLREICGTRFYFTTGSRDESRRFRNLVPVLLRNNPLFRPFELLVRMMGTPGNMEVDPTPAAALAYVIIFGVMFGDAGQGLVLVLTGFIINRYGSRKYGGRNNVSDFGAIMTWCGISAALFGLLYGSIFSNEHIIPAFLFHPMEHMMELFMMAIMTGALFISAGLLLNVVNGLSSGHYGESLFGTKGVAGLVLYGSCIYLALRFVIAGRVPVPGEIALALSVPLALFCARGPLEFLLFHGEQMFPDGLFEYTVETIIEVIEMFSGFLGNTISYIRAGAFALSHAGLSMAIFTLAGMVNPAMNSIGAISVIVTGNLFIILLEGLVCAIQSMRLEYYEFFSKFYRGDGVAFAPFYLGLKHVKDGGGNE